MDNPVSKIAGWGLILLATARATRFITSDWLGEWTISGPAHEWAQAYEEQARRDEYRAARDRTPGPFPPYDHWGSSKDDAGPRTWQGKLVKGLDCPFCVGFWIGGLILLGEVTLGRSPLRGLWRFGLGMLGLNYLVGHLSSRIDS